MLLHLLQVLASSLVQPPDQQHPACAQQQRTLFAKRLRFPTVYVIDKNTNIWVVDPKHKSPSLFCKMEDATAADEALSRQNTLGYFTRYGVVSLLRGLLHAVCLCSLSLAE
jgi:hypothetical protein